MFLIQDPPTKRSLIKYFVSLYDPLYQTIPQELIYWKGYGACVYIKIINLDRTIKTTVRLLS